MKLGRFFLVFAFCAFAVSAQTYHIFTMTNGTPNQVLMYTRASDGTLNLTATTTTGGNGSGSYLGSQGSVLAVGKAVFAVNAGSNSISVLNVKGSNLVLLSTVSSNGNFPCSLTYSNGVIYVLNAGGAGSISGFTFDKSDGALTLIAGSTQPLSGMPTTGGAQVGFSKNGEFLIVTEKLTNLIDIYSVTGGVAGPPTTYSSNAPTPYGFATGLKNRFYLSEGNAAVPNGSSVSSYALSSTGSPQIISGSVPTNQYAACWVALNAANTIAYVSDNESSAVSVFSIDSGGHLAVIQTVSTPGGPFDNAVSGDGLYYYQLIAGPSSYQIVPYSIGAGGLLTQLASVNGTTFGIGLATLTN
jgi:6-phosphogluconolactonase (cycloisomerase 2 family)